jgi:hypothetical protein
VAGGPERLLGVPAPDRVDHHVDATTGELAGPGLQVLVLVGDRRLGTHGHGRIELVGSRGGGDHPGAEGGGHVDGGKTDPTTGPEDQHPFAGNDGRPARQREQHRAVALDQGGGLAEVERIGHGHQ